jgi:ApaG protein
MATKKGFIELEGLKVSVDKVVYRKEAQTPDSRPHCFAYFISILNNSDRVVTIKARKWVVTNAEGEISAVEADGVVGECPTIPVGEQFSYNSYHLLDVAPGVAEGSYLATDEAGHRILARIPRFEMVIPPD